MEVSKQQLVERFEVLSTEELLGIFSEGGLSGLAKPILKAELDKRNISSSDYDTAAGVNTFLRIDREATERKASRYVWGFVISLLSLVLSQFLWVES